MKTLEDVIETLEWHAKKARSADVSGFDGDTAKAIVGRGHECEEMARIVRQAVERLAAVEEENAELRKRLPNVSEIRLPDLGG